MGVLSPASTVSTDDSWMLFAKLGLRFVDSRCDTSVRHGKESAKERGDPSPACPAGSGDYLARNNDAERARPNDSLPVTGTSSEAETNRATTEGEGGLAQEPPCDLIHLPDAPAGGSVIAVRRVPAKECCSP